MPTSAIGKCPAQEARGLCSLLDQVQTRPPRSSKHRGKSIEAETNSCTGCRKCTCDALGQWACILIYDCGGRSDFDSIGDKNLENALEELQIELFNNKNTKQPSQSEVTENILAKLNKNNDGNLLDDNVQEEDIDRTLDKEILAILRRKRSLEDESINNEPDANETIVFHNVVDELNEDTLKDSNASGTIILKKMYPEISRRTGKDLINHTYPNSLHIEHNEPRDFANHITDNNMTGDKQYTVSHKKIQKLQNETQKEKDKVLSKIIVNELKKGSEVVGDKDAPIISNITFTPENDTLTAMAFIAGNLLNRLWNLEKEERDDSTETDLIKQRKLSDLLDLFKEPLSIRQETFLKNALLKLSEAVNQNKEIDNVTLCDNFKEVKNSFDSFSDLKNNSSGNNTQKSVLRNSENGTQFNAGTKKAFSNIQSVLKLIEKFDHVQTGLQSLKNNEPSTANLSKSEADSLDQFGKILQKLTKLLIPDKSVQRRTLKKIKDNYKDKSDEVLSKSNTLFDLDLSDVNLTTKDKLLLGYLSKIEKIPDCLFRTGGTVPLIAKGDIMRNLSEFMKIKSYIDLMKIIKQDEKQKITTTTTRITTRTTTTTEFSKHPIAREAMTAPNLLKTKEKLKDHLKSIIEDLSEIQKAKGVPQNNLTIASLLPCVQNLLYNDDNKFIAAPKNSLDKIKNLFDDLKADFKGNSLETRRNLNLEPRPKSAKVFERVVRTLDKLRQQKTRRSSNIKPSKSYDDLKKVMDNLEKTGYVERYTSFDNVPPHKKLILLKTLQMNLRRYSDLLENLVQTTTDNPQSIIQNYAELQRFLKSAISSIISSHNLFKKVHRTTNTRRLLPQTKRSNEVTNNKNTLLNFLKERHNDLKLSREQLLKQLIRNRVEKYLSLKKANPEQEGGDGSYSIAKSVLWYLNNNNFELAKQLYKALVGEKVWNQEDVTVTTTTTSNYDANFKRMRPSLHRYEELQPTSDQSVLFNQDNLLKQLLNIKNLRSS